jgi:two-component system cell cycle response regulator DivK
MACCLIVEDHGDTREGYAEFLRLCRFDVLTASNATEFRKTVERVIPDVVIMDLQLPETDGWDLMAELRQNPQTRHVPIIVVSARVMPADRERSMDAGCDAFLPKPCDPQALVDEVHRLLDGRGVPAR